jgi:hypothetical protein
LYQSTLGSRVIKKKAKFELPENIYTDDFEMTQFEKVRPI